jgi:hypothetical protein
MTIGFLGFGNNADAFMATPARTTTLSRTGVSLISTRDNHHHHPRLSESDFRLDVIQGLNPTKGSYNATTATIDEDDCK